MTDPPTAATGNGAGPDPVKLTPESEFFRVIRTPGNGAGPDPVKLLSPTETVAAGISTPASRYEILDEIARGGMGVVYRATDAILGREVAVKVLHDRFKPTSVAARRFVGEARIAGQLQHPGIPAVHDLGTLPDGRPFLAMRLVKGRTLDELLKKPSPSVPNLLAVFEQVCHAVGYAHAHSVVHRDLKPANIMVGAFGEVQVMDWGLAKVLGAAADQREPTAADATTAAVTAIDSDRGADDATRAGSVLGTPAYMPPEQAIGAVDQVDARSDVFGLGAILCAILTGKPPYIGVDAESTRQLAARARLDDASARLDACGAEPELVALCKRCLSAEQSDRPADAGAVARAVADLRAAAEARARAAELEQAKALTQAREQRKRRWTLAGAAAVLILGLAAFALVQRHNANQLAEEESQTRAAKDLAENRLKEATGIWYSQVIDVQNQLDDQNISPVLRQSLLRSAREKIVDLLKDQPRTREVDHMMHVLHRRLAESSLSLGEMDVVEREWSACWQIAEARFRDDPDGPDSHRDLASAHMTRGDIKARANDLPTATAEFEEAIRLFDAHAAIYPADRRITADRLLMASRLGNVHVRAGRAKDAVATFQAGLALARTATTASPDHVGYARSHFNFCQLVGDTALRVEQSKEAVDRYSEALAVVDRMRQKDPDNLQFVRDRSTALWSLGDLEYGRDRMSAARRYYLQSLELRQQIADRPGAPPQAFLDVALVFQGLGSISSHTRNYPQAIVEFTEQVRNIRRALSRGDDPARQNYLASALVRLGWAQQGDRRWNEARQSLTDCLAIRRELREKGSGAVQSIVDEAEANSYLAFLDRGAPFYDLAAALAHCRTGVELLEPLEKGGKFEGQPEWKKTLETHRQNVAYLEWAVKTLDPVDVVRKRSSADKALVLRAKVMACRGQVGEASATAAALDSLPRTLANMLAAARAYVMASAAAGPPAPNDPNGARAVAVLRDWTEDGGDPDLVRRDPDFAPLLGRDDFQKLLAGQLTAPSPGRPAVGRPDGEKKSDGEVVVPEGQVFMLNKDTIAVASEPNDNGQYTCTVTAAAAPSAVRMKAQKWMLGYYPAAAKQGGVEVGSVLDSGPLQNLRTAAKMPRQPGGWQIDPGDVITHVNGYAVKTVEELICAVHTAEDPFDIQLVLGKKDKKEVFYVSAVRK